MQKSHLTWRARLALSVIVLAFTACQDPAAAPAAPAVDAARFGGGAKHPFTVYTQNMYLGGDTGPLFTLDFTDLGAILGATGPFWIAVQGSDIPGRAAKFVDHIQKTRPDVVAFQEALRFVILDASFQPVDGRDLLASVQAEIARRHLPYEVAVEQDATTATLPLSFDPSVGVTRWLNFTDRSVILKRTDVQVISSSHGLYAAHLTLGPVQLVRAWTSVTIERDGAPIHFFTTQLETPPGTAIQDAQAAELEDSILAGLDGLTVLAGDLNSDAAAAQGAPTWTATYGSLIDAGFTDVWLPSPHAHGARAFTCCQAPNLLGPSQLDQRIDFVLVRSADGGDAEHGRSAGNFKSELVGDETSDRTAGGLWPSDHAGLVARIVIPTSQRDRTTNDEVAANH